MMTPLDIDTRVKTLNLTITKDSNAMISYSLFTHFEAVEAVEPIIKRIQGLFRIMSHR